jgi:hypothetical protein
MNLGKATTRAQIVKIFLVKTTTQSNLKNFIADPIHKTSLLYMFFYWNPFFDEIFYSNPSFKFQCLNSTTNESLPIVQMVVEARTGGGFMARGS